MLFKFRRKPKQTHDYDHLFENQQQTQKPPRPKHKEEPLPFLLATLEILLTQTNQINNPETEFLIYQKNKSIEQLLKWTSDIANLICEIPESESNCWALSYEDPEFNESGILTKVTILEENRGCMATFVLSKNGTSLKAERAGSNDTWIIEPASSKTLSRDGDINRIDSAFDNATDELEKIAPNRTQAKRTLANIFSLFPEPYKSIFKSKLESTEHTSPLANHITSELYSSSNSLKNTLFGTKKENIPPGATPTKGSNVSHTDKEIGGISFSNI